jgi:hypothetical protein
MDETWHRRVQFDCGLCRDMLQAGDESVAVLAARAPNRDPGDGLCRRHLRDLLAEVPDSRRGGIVASRLEAAARALAEGREIPACAVCSRQEDVARRRSGGSLCLHHLRRQAPWLTWDAIRRDASRLAGVMDQRHGSGTPATLWGSEGLVGTGDGDDTCSICAARGAARIRLFEWLADAVHRFPAQAAGAAVAVCAAHGWWFADFSSGFGRMLADLAAERWTSRLRWLLAGLEHRPPDRLAARLAALPATLGSLADGEGRLHIAVIARATAAAVLRTPTAVLAQLTASTLSTGVCPVCAAEDRAALKVAAAGGAFVCASDLRLVRSANPDTGAWQAMRRATASRLEREAAVLTRSGPSATTESSGAGGP